MTGRGVSKIRERSVPGHAVTRRCHDGPAGKLESRISAANQDRERIGKIKSVILAKLATAQGNSRSEFAGSGMISTTLTNPAIRTDTVERLSDFPHSDARWRPEQLPRISASNMERPEFVYFTMKSDKISADIPYSFSYDP